MNNRYQLEQKWRGFVLDNIVTGYALVYNDLTVEQLSKIKYMCDTCITELKMLDDTSPNVDTLALYQVLKGIVEDTSLSWEGKYDKVFDVGVSDKIVNTTNLVWCGSDGSYEEDVLSFYEAFKRYIKDQL